ncbi:MAG: glycosyltransferase [Candidatus Gracilibacteria bacterium]|nr:glycosyltransferase [Candidatus Gracilibacteria bacterium]
MKDKKILILIPEIKNYGGMVLWGKILGDNLIKNNYKVSYLTIYKEGDNKNLNNKSEYFYFSPGKISTNNYLMKFFYIFKLIIEYFYFIWKIKPDIIISGGSFLNMVNIIGKLFNYKSIISIHSSINSETKINIFLQKIIYKKADKIVTINIEEKENLINNFSFNKNQITTIYNSIDIEKVKKIKNEKIEDELENIFNNGKKTYIHIGRLSKEKNHIFLLKNFNKFNKDNINTQLIFLGDGPEKEKIIKYMKQLKNENIHYFGLQNNVYKFLNKSDFLILNSLYEGFPIVFIEALTLGIPIISLDFKTGAKECIRQNNNLKECLNNEIHTNGILIPYMNEKLFIKGLKKGLNNKFNSNEIKKNSKIFDINNTIKQWIQIIEEK